MLLLDVDGPLNPTMTPPVAHRKGYTRHDIHSDRDGKTYPVLLNRAHGDALLALTDTFDLVWATTWRDEANTHISPLLGLPTDLPVIDWPDGAEDSYRRGSWKTEHIALWVGKTPFAWFDDEINSRDRRYLAQTHYIGPHLAHRVEDRTGLRDIDFTTVRNWAHALT
jgi:hypothetical protein